MTFARESDRAAGAETFRALQAPGCFLALPNCWDAGSARVLVDHGASAVATSSAALAWSHGYPDGERLPFDALVQAVAAITRVVAVPVSVDAERGFGASPAEVGESVARLVGAGAVGINIEDGDGTPDELAARVEAARRVGEREGVALFVNARTDLWLRNGGPGPGLVAEAARRGRLYADAGASGYFLPRAAPVEELKAIADAARLPLNLMAVPGLPDAGRLRGLGVTRVSLGVASLLKAYGALTAPVGRFLRDGTVDGFFAGARTFAEIDALFR